jgi:hypothetical protein
VNVNIKRFTNCLVILVMSTVALVSTSMIPIEAHASYSICRSDPALVLSNGTVLDLSASISTALSNVSSVTYVVHLPAGVRPLLVLNTDGLMGIKEHFVSYSDDSSGAYDTYTTVATVGGSTSVTAHALVVSLLSIGAPSVSGISGSPIHIHLGR